VALAGAHSYLETQSREESFQFWVGARRPAAPAQDGPRPSVGPAPTPQHGRHDLPTTTPPATTKTNRAATEAEEDASLAPLERMLKALVEKLFGVKIRVAFVPPTEAQPLDLPTGADCPRPAGEPEADGEPRQGWGLDYQLRETRTESERTDFSAQGVVRTADGQDLKFEVSLTMQREFTQQSEFRLRAGDALIDPLVLNFNGTAASLTDQRYAFDLNADGQNENVPFVKAGSAFLALDKNSDGKINNGRELFGPTTGNGFSELAQYDADGNAWIDESDPVYARLRLWSRDDAGKTQLTTLAEKGVGAIYLGSSSTPFTLKTDAQQTQGQIASTGVYLKEQGGVGLVQQVNLVA
jgi:hypothetical protein